VGDVQSYDRLVEYSQHVDAVERETTAMVDALRDGPLEARVPSCPDWNVADLVKHVSEFTGFWTHVLCEGTGRPKTPFPDMPSGGVLAVADWYKQLAFYLVNELRATEPGTTVWTWVPDDNSARFAARRCANELAIHRFDLQLARGQPGPIDEALAVDGIEEIFVMIRARPAPTGYGRGESIRLHDTASGGEWLLTLTDHGLKVDASRAAADLTVRGAGSDLELLLYQRPTRGPVERVGDDAALEAWYQAFTFG
jgi:uncharacterized protein (TIGR03083 family)